MSDATFPFPGWEGFTADSFTPLSPTEYLISLVPVCADKAHCGECGHVCNHIHDTVPRRIRDRDLFEYRIWLMVPLRRVVCPSCGIRRERLDWLLPHSRMTYRLRQHVEVLSSLLPIKHVAQLTGLHWHTIKSIDKARLHRDTPTPQREKLRYLVMDEFALFKGHRYASVVIDAETKQVLWVGEGRSRAAIRPFFEWLGEYCQQIEAVAMDMNTAMDLEVQAHCPEARVVYDLFHVVAKFGREVIDRVRVDQANRLREDRPARQAVKRSRWLLLRNADNLRTEQAEKLEDLLALNQPLMVVYLMKTQLKELWYATSENSAWKHWKQWYRQAMESGLKPLIQFAKRLERYAEGIVASATYRLHTSVLEGINNRIKVIKRMAYGFRDNEYFFMKIKAAFPGNPR